MAITTASNRSLAPSAVRTVTPHRVACDVRDGMPGPDRAVRQGRHDPIDVAHRTALDRPPLERVPVADQPVVVEEAEQVVDREVEDPVGCGGPDRGRDRDEEMAPEPVPYPTVIEEVAEGRR